MTVASAPEAYNEIFYIETLVFVSSSPLVRETELCCTVRMLGIAHPHIPLTLEDP